MSAATVRNVTRTWLSILHEVLLVGLMERPGVPAEHMAQAGSEDSAIPFYYRYDTLFMELVLLHVIRLYVFFLFLF